MKFKLKLSPVRSDSEAALVAIKGASLVISGAEFDFSFLNDGDTLPNAAIESDVICSDVTRTGDTIELTIRLPHGPDAPESVRFPQPILVEQDGPITLPGETNVY